MRWIEFGTAIPTEVDLLNQIRRVLDQGASPGPGWEEVRSRLERKVWRVSAGEQVVFVKFQLYRSFRVRFRYALRLAPTLKEARVSQRLLARGFEVPVPLIHGELGCGGRRQCSVLVTRGIVGQAVDLDLSALARLVADLRQKGIYHPDLHLNNLLWTDSGPVLLDLQSVRFFPGGTGCGRALAMAVKLGLSLEKQGQVKRDDWLTSLASLGVFPGLDLAPAYTRLAQGMAQDEVASRVRRCLMNSTLFARESWSGGRIFRRRVADREELLVRAREAFGQGKKGLVQLADGTLCLVGRGGRVRQAWRDLRRQEVEEGGFSPPLALVVSGWGPWGKGCVIFAAHTGREMAEKLLAGS